MYRTLTYWEDLKDGRHPYNKGDVYPREGLKPSDARIKELSTTMNIRGTKLIEEIPEKEPEKEPVKEAEKEPEKAPEIPAPKPAPKKGKTNGNTAGNAKSRPRKTK